MLEDKEDMKKPLWLRSLRILTPAVALMFTPAAVFGAEDMTSPAKQAILVDYDTATVLFEKNADEAMAPASMSKLMTSYMVFDRLKDGRLKMEDEFTISKKAWKMGGSKMYVEVAKQARIDDLLRGIIVQSGNDACIVVAEGIAGSEEEFSKLMTKTGKKLGLKNSQFQNASGWPHPDHYMTARDLATLSKVLISEFPDYYKMFAEKNFTYTGIRQGNRNPLLYKNLGADGLKTGYTRASGYGLTASAVRDGRRLILVLNGLKSVNQRSRESERLLMWGFRQFQNYTFFPDGEVVDHALVWLGDKDRVALVLERPFKVTLQRGKRAKLKAKVVYEGPVAAPIKKGQRIAELVLEAPGMDPIRTPLLAAEGSKKLGTVKSFVAALKYLLWGASGGR